MKKLVLGIFIGVLLCGSIVYASTLLDSKDVVYNPSDSSFNVDNVKGALDELYDSANKSLTVTRLINWIQGTSPSYTFQADYKAAVIKVYNSNSSYTVRYNGQVLSYTTAVTGSGVYVMEYFLTDVKTGDTVSCSLSNAIDGMSVVVLN